MLDSDLAELYGVETKNLNKAVKRNVQRFLAGFMFQLTPEEFRSLRFQFGTSKARGGLRYRPFMKLRGVLETNREFAQKFSELEQRVGKHDEEIAAILEAIRQLMAPPEKTRREIGFHVRERTGRYRAITRA